MRSDPVGFRFWVLAVGHHAEERALRRFQRPCRTPTAACKRAGSRGRAWPRQSGTQVARGLKRDGPARRRTASRAPCPAGGARRRRRVSVRPAPVSVLGDRLQGAGGGRPLVVTGAVAPGLGGVVRRAGQRQRNRPRPVAHDDGHIRPVAELEGIGSGRADELRAERDTLTRSAPKCGRSPPRSETAARTRAAWARRCADPARSAAVARRARRRPG